MKIELSRSAEQVQLWFIEIAGCDSPEDVERFLRDSLEDTLQFEVGSALDDFSTGPDNFCHSLCKGKVRSTHYPVIQNALGKNSSIFCPHDCLVMDHLQRNIAYN